MLITNSKTTIYFEITQVVESLGKLSKIQNRTKIQNYFQKIQFFANLTQ